MNYAPIVWDTLMEAIDNPYGVAGLIGNLYAESGLNPLNLQGSFESKLGYTDGSYTQAVDEGTYHKFITDGAGYGLAQWTYSTRKSNLLGMTLTLKLLSTGVNFMPSPTIIVA